MKSPEGVYATTVCSDLRSRGSAWVLGAPVSMNERVAKTCSRRPYTLRDIEEQRDVRREHHGSLARKKVRVCLWS